MDDRQMQLAAWAKKTICEHHSVSTDPLDFKWQVISADASFRRYFRLSWHNKTWVAVDAPPLHENLTAFLQVQKILLAHHVNAPQLIAVDSTQGFMLLSDLGDTLLLSVLKAEPTKENPYRSAIQALVQIQSIPKESFIALPSYDAKRLMDEMQLFRDWHVTQFLGYPLSPTEERAFQLFCQQLIEDVLRQPSVLVHRDYHSRNLMVLPQEKLGVIDFQDAVIGPIAYDWVSILKDCYMAWPRSLVEEWMQEALSLLKEKLLLEETLEPPIWLQWFDAMGLQRHIKIVGIFSRLCLRDGKAGYLEDIPLTYAYILDAIDRDPRYSDWGRWLKETILPLYYEKNPKGKEKILQWLAILKRA